MIIQPETRELNFYDADTSLQQLLKLYLPADQRLHMQPHFKHLGTLVGSHLDELAFAADQNPPQLEHRNRQGEDTQRVIKHPAYRELERLAFEEFQLAAVSHRPAFGWPDVLHPLVKYALSYLFVQSEFGLLCPVNMTDSLTRTIRKFADPQLLDHYLPALLAEDFDTQYQGAMFMTEKAAGSDVGATSTRAVTNGKQWQLYGDKWFCSNVDAELALVLARPEDAETGTRGLGLFLLPRFLPDGQPNHYRIVRLKNKLGSRSMASGEIILEGAIAYLVGQLGEGFKQMAEMVNQSRLSNGVRAAGMMRRACHEALAVARGRSAFGKQLIEQPLMQRQLLKLLLPTEAALSMICYTADVLHRADQGDENAAILRRILTPLIKFRACRDARKVTADAMEVRGGCGYIEEWIEPRLLRDSHLGSIWEGTSNIVALDVIRAARKQQCHQVLKQTLIKKLQACKTIAPDLQHYLTQQLERVVNFTDQVVADADHEQLARQTASALYYITAAVLMAYEGEENPQRLLWSQLLLKHKLLPHDPLATDTMTADELSLIA